MLHECLELAELVTESDDPIRFPTEFFLVEAVDVAINPGPTAASVDLVEVLVAVPLADNRGPVMCKKDPSEITEADTEAERLLD